MYFSIQRFIYQLLGKAPSGKTKETRTSLFILETPVLGPNWLLFLFFQFDDFFHKFGPQEPVIKEDKGTIVAHLLLPFKAYIFFS